MNNNLLVSICMITYNHASFVREAIEGVLSQKTRFKFELIISDDVSTDNTREICEYYQRDYPEIIRLVFREQNLGICKNFYHTLSLAQGQYVAVCEGDDYWTDPYKLQKQVDYLSVHPSAIMLYHNAVVDTDGRKSLFIPLNKEHHVLCTEELLFRWAIPTASIVFRRDSFFVPNPFKVFTNADYMLEILLNTKGEIHYVPDIMSVYRRHADSASDILNRNRLSLYRGLVDMLQYCKQFYPEVEKPLFEDAIVRYGNMAKAIERDKKYPFLKYCDWRFYKRLIFKRFRIKRV